MLTELEMEFDRKRQEEITLNQMMQQNGVDPEQLKALGIDPSVLLAGMAPKQQELSSPSVKPVFEQQSLQDKNIQNILGPGNPE